MSNTEIEKLIDDLREEIYAYITEKLRSEILPHCKDKLISAINTHVREQVTKSFLAGCKRGRAEEGHREPKPWEYPMCLLDYLQTTEPETDRKELYDYVLLELGRGINE